MLSVNILLDNFIDLSENVFNFNASNCCSTAKHLIILNIDLFQFTSLSCSWWRHPHVERNWKTVLTALLLVVAGIGQ